MTLSNVVYQKSGRLGTLGDPRLLATLTFLFGCGLRGISREFLTLADPKSHSHPVYRYTYCDGGTDLPSKLTASCQRRFYF